MSSSCDQQMTRLTTQNDITGIKNSNLPQRKHAEQIIKSTVFIKHEIKNQKSFKA